MITGNQTAILGSVFENVTFDAPKHPAVTSDDMIIFTKLINDEQTSELFARLVDMGWHMSIDWTRLSDAPALAAHNGARCKRVYFTCYGRLFGIDLATAEYQKTRQELSNSFHAGIRIPKRKSEKKSRFGYTFLCVFTGRILEGNTPLQYSTQYDGYKDSSAEWWDVSGTSYRAEQ